MWVDDPPPINTLVTVIDGTLNTTEPLHFHYALCSRSVTNMQPSEQDACAFAIEPHI